MASVPGWVYKRYAYGDISAEEVHELEKLAESLSNEGVSGAVEVVKDKSNNLKQVLESVDQKDRDDVLRALRRMKAMKKEASFDKEANRKLLALLGLGGTLAAATPDARRAVTNNPTIQNVMHSAYTGSTGMDAVRAHDLYKAEGGKGALFSPEFSGDARLEYNMRQQREKRASGCASHSKPSSTKKRLKKVMKKQAMSPNFGTAAAIMGGAALAPVMGHMAMRGVNALTQKSSAQIQQDLKRILQVHPDIGRANDPRVQMAYASLVRLNPEYAEDPLIAGPLLKQIVESRMDPTNPRSASMVDPAMAKHLSDARKSHLEADRFQEGLGLGGDMRRSIMGGTQTASGQLFKK